MPNGFRKWFDQPMFIGFCTVVIASFSCNPSNPKAATAPSPAANAAPATIAATAGTLQEKMQTCEQKTFTAQKMSCQYAVVADSVKEGVVSIHVSKKMARRRMPSLFDFFGIPEQKRQKMAPKRRPEPRSEDDNEEEDADVQEGSGSGFVIDAQQGLIVTNHHVVGEADTIEVIFLNGKKQRAELLGSDAVTDVALVKLTKFDAKKTPLKQLLLGNSGAMLPGEAVMAVGNPFGLDHSVNVGVLSAVGRKDITSSVLGDSLQIDAPINPGNSGGPLVNLSGEVIGINNAIFGPGANIGIGFAIPSDLARPVIEALIKDGKVRRGFLGIEMKPIPEERLKAVKRFAGDKLIPKGAVAVRVVQKGSPAEKAGVQAGDWIIKVEGKAVEGSEDMAFRFVQRAVFSHKPGDAIQIEVLRDQKPDPNATEDNGESRVRKLTLTITLATMPEKAEKSKVNARSLPEDADE